MLKKDLPSGNNDEFQRMMANITSQNPEQHQTVDDENHDDTSFVLISNNGKDFQDTGASIRNQAFLHMMAGLGLGEDPVSDQDEKDRKKQKELQEIALHEAMRNSRDIANQGGELDILKAQIQSMVNSFDKKFEGYEDDGTADEINSAEDVDRIISRKSLYGLHGGSIPRVHGNSNVSFGSIKIEMGERQIRVNNAIHEASKITGVPAQLSAGMWGVESGFGKNRLSPTGCLGDHQFTKGTFIGVIKAHGHEIPGLQKAMKEVGGNVQALRDHPEISTYASQFYIKDLAEGLGVDVKDKSNWGTLYAAYNVGPGGVRKLLALAEKNPDAVAKDKLGFVAQVNPMFYRKGATASEALDNYQAAVEARITDHEKAFGKSDGLQITSAKNAPDASGQEKPKPETPLVTASKDITMPAIKAEPKISLVDELMNKNGGLKIASTPLLSLEIDS